MTSSPILRRYLLREATVAWLAVTVILLAVMVSTRFAGYLAQAAAGELTRDLLVKVVALSSLRYLVILTPVSLLLAVMLALGRLYRDQEITVMSACGIGLAGLYRPFAGLALAIATLTAALSFEIGPWAGREADYLVRSAQRLIQFTPFEPGRFTESAGGRAVFYAADTDQSGRHVKTVFIDVLDPAAAGVVTAKTGEQTINPDTGEREIVLRNGYRYAGEPGRSDYEVMRFAEYGTRITPPDFIYMVGSRKVGPTFALIGSANPEDLAELQWRMAAPISVLILALLAVPLAHVPPHRGRYGRVALGVLVYMFYSNLLGLGRTWIASGVLPAALGLWWVHGAMLALALWLIARRTGWVVGTSR